MSLDDLNQIAAKIVFAIIGLAEVGLGIAWATTAIELGDYSVPLFGAIAWGGTGVAVLTVLAMKWNDP